MEKSKRKRIVLYLVLIGGLALLVCYFDEILAFFGQVGGVSLPLALGCGIAYVLNIIMSAMERHYFTKKDAPWVAKTRRPVCLAASIFVVLGIIFLLIRVVAPELLNAVLLLGEGIPVYVEKGIEWAVDHSGSERLAGKSCHRLAEDHPSVPGKSDGDPELYSGACRPFKQQYRPPVHEPDFWNLSPLGKGETPRSGQADPESFFAGEKL